MKLENVALLYKDQEGSGTRIGDVLGSGSAAWSWEWQHAWRGTVWTPLQSQLKPISVKIDIPCQLPFIRLPLLNLE